MNERCTGNGIVREAEGKKNERMGGGAESVEGGGRI